MPMIPTDAAVKTALLPLLLAQGGWARWRAGRLPEPPGPRNGVSGAGRGLSLLVVGDSSAAGVGAAHQDQALMGRLVAGLAPEYRLRWRLEARTGDTTACALTRLEQVAPERFDMALVVLGVNDITGGLSLTRLLARRARLHALLRRKFRAKRIIASGLPPVGRFPALPNPLRWVLGQQVTRFDAALQAQAAAEGVEYIPFDIPFRPELMASDGFHPGPEAYRLWAGMLMPHIRGKAGPARPPA
ncbi:MAG TPA: SGNH/GDSL hydrolase family protein [Aliiroseovarius sp.]|nr:SGNH/GDSL hydrolase family protein [Aliiroseovarius sp.]